MNRDARLKAAYYGVLAIPEEPTQRNIQDMLKRMYGKTIQTKDVIGFLKSVANQLQSSSGSVAKLPRKTDISVASQEQVSSPSHARVAKVLELEYISSETNVSSPKPRQQRLRLVDDKEQRAREILEVFWPIVKSAVGPTLTKDTWKSQNKTMARNFAEVGRSDADLIVAHKKATERIGSCVYSLRLVADELLRVPGNGATRTSRPTRTPHFALERAYAE
jgi:hypothetical protein